MQTTRRKRKPGLPVSELQTEKPKLSAVMTTTAPQKLTDIFKRVEAQGKVIEQAPAPNPAA